MIFIFTFPVKQFVTFEPISYSFEETIGFDVEASFASCPEASFANLPRDFHGLKITN